MTSPTETNSCRLCKAPLKGAPSATGDFCCHGCARVYEVLQGLDESAGAVYLEAARKLGIIPGGPAPQRPAKTPEPVSDPSALKEERYHAAGLFCPSCSWVMEQVMSSVPGVQSVKVDFFSSSCLVGYDLRRASLDRFQEVLKPLGYGLSAIDLQQASSSGRRATLDFAICGVLFMNLMSLAILRYSESLGWLDRVPPLVKWLELLLTLPVLAIGWLPMARRAWVQLVHGRAGMDFLISLGAGAAFLLSLVALWSGRADIYFETSAGLVTISLLSRMIEARLRDKAYSDLARLMRLECTCVRKPEGDDKYSYPEVNAVQPGDSLLFFAGEMIPFDGTSQSAEVYVSEAMLTGESAPVKKVSGDRMVAGSTLTEGALNLRVIRRFNETQLHEITQSLQSSLARQESRLNSADRIAQWFAPLVLLFAVAIWIIRGLNWGWAAALTPPAWFPSVAVLAVACPCAFSLAGVAAVTAATGSLLRKGILVKETAQLETLHTIKRIIFDKTGTLTRGAMRVERLCWRDKERRPLLLPLLLAAEEGSPHPVAAAIRQFLQEEAPRIAVAAGGELEDLPGQGRKMTVEGRCFCVGAQALFSELFPLSGVAVNHTLVWFGMDGKAEGCFVLADPLRSEAQDAVAWLARQNYELELLSGDRQSVCDWIGSQLGIDNCRGEVSLEQKLQIVADYQEKETSVAFVGDGTNDALALAQARLSIALSHSTDEALAASGFVLLQGKLDSLPTLLRAGKKLARVVRDNYVWAFAFNTVFIPVAALGHLTPLVAMLLMLVSSTAVLLNSLRLRNI